MISVPRGRGLSAGVTVKLPGPVRLPLPAGLFAVAPGPDPHPVGDHERRVEPDAELADQREVGLGSSPRPRGS